MEANQAAINWYEGLNAEELQQRLYEVNERYWDLQDALGAIVVEQAHLLNRLKGLKNE